MAIWDSITNLFGEHSQNIQDLAQNIPGADIVDQASQTLTDATGSIEEVVSPLGDTVQNVQDSVTENIGNITDQLPKL